MAWPKKVKICRDLPLQWPFEKDVGAARSVFTEGGLSIYALEVHIMYLTVSS
jgi:hypothetical protein